MTTTTASASIVFIFFKAAHFFQIGCRFSHVSNKWTGARTTKVRPTLWWDRLQSSCPTVTKQWQHQWPIWVQDSADIELCGHPNDHPFHWPLNDSCCTIHKQQELLHIQQRDDVRWPANAPVLRSRCLCSQTSSVLATWHAHNNNILTSQSHNH